MSESYYRSKSAAIVKGVEFQADGGGGLVVSLPGPGQIKPEVWRVPPGHIVIARCVEGKVYLSACPDTRSKFDPPLGAGGPYKGD